MMENESTKYSTLATPANLVTYGRILLLFSLAFSFRIDNQVIRIGCIVCVPLLFYLDSLDGYLARHLDCKTKLGSVLDVVGDRIVENVLWLLLAYLHLIPFWIPVLIISRGFLIDGFRSIATAQGQTPFSIMRTFWGRLFVSSPLSRTSYALSKAILFTLGLSIWSLQLQDVNGIIVLFTALVFLNVVFCLLRGYYAVKECLVLLR
ncbi:hypothetical protein A2V82_01670 [candidate division KSB1 bacterium RBG_16_48_16]|nr:MAG: hypothetical protein A2V82_01670 [candidate division KSB1 bacterium RBG_16_48_16]